MGRYRINPYPRQLGIAVSLLFLVSFSNCGGGGSSSPPPPPPTPPTITSISPSSLIAGQAAFTLTVSGTRFASNSVVRWNGADRATTFVSTIQLIAQIPAPDIVKAGTFQVTAATPGVPQLVSNPATFTATTPQPLDIRTASLPPSASGKKYFFVLAGSGGVPPLSWSVVSGSGALPSALTLGASSGLISGTLVGGSSTFTVQLTDFKKNSKTRPLTLEVSSTLTRNDNVCISPSVFGTDQPVPISNGTLRASISPYGDIDTYSFTLTTSVTSLSIETFAQRLNIGSNLSARADFLDTALELLDDNCNLIALSDDVSFSPTHIQDSLIRISSAPLPTPTLGDPNFNPSDDPAPTSLPEGTYFIRVRDFRGDGRPDLIYNLTLTGVK